MHTPNEITLASIEHAAKEFSDARKRLTDRVVDLKRETEAITRKRLPGIREAVALAAVARSMLERAILAAPSLFVKPRTINLHGVKVGYQKGKGGLDWDDSDALVQRIEKLCPELADTLLRVKKEPVADALEQLDAATLKKLGVRVVESGDTVVIKDAAGNVDKLVAKLLEEHADRSQEAA